MDLKICGKRLAQVRKERKLTQAQVAEKTGMNMQYYSRIERGMVNFGVDKLIAIAQVLDVSYDYLLDGRLYNNPVRANLTYHLHQGIHKMDEAQLSYMVNMIETFQAFCNHELPLIPTEKKGR